MAVIQQNSFTSFNLTDDELKEGSKLTIPQIQVIQNLIATTAEDKLMLEFTPDKPLEFAQQEAYKRGQLDILRHLLDASEFAKQYESSN